MGINNLAVQTFSSSGSQSVTRANKADSSKQITSDFISRPSISYINGSGLSVINGTIKVLPYKDINSETFRIPNNIDAISDMVLNMDLNITKTAAATFACDGIYYSKTFLLDVIKNVEIKMGGLIIQTIYPGDIYMRNYSELGYVISQENSFNKKINVSNVDTENIIGHTTTSQAETISFSVSLPFIGRNHDKNRSFLQTGSFTKNLTVTVNYNSCNNVAAVNELAIIPLLHNTSSTGSAVATSVSTKLCILSHIITDTEKNFIKQNIINRVINTSSGIVINDIAARYIKLSTGLTPIEIDLDQVDLNVTHLLFCLNVNIFQGTNEPKQYLNTSSSTTTPVVTVDGVSTGGVTTYTYTTTITPTVLKTASEYVNGDNKLSSSWGKAGLDSNKSVATLLNPDVLGVFEGWLSSAELVLGTETTGKIPCSVLTSNQAEFKLINVEANFYILKLADNAFSTAGVPFSRIKNKKLILEVRNKFFNTGTVTKPIATNVNSVAVATTIATYSSEITRDATISVCACGTTLEIINNNTISFSYI
jgi:hypothetical protein